MHENDEEVHISTVKPEGLNNALPKYQRLLPVHFEELNALWPGDPRIPTTTSRKAWASARCLNPINVNNWWYRRRKVAKKLKIVIPKETYDQDVGIPPIITIEPVKEEESLILFLGDSAPLFSSETDDTTTHIPSSDDISAISDSSATTITLSNFNYDEKGLESIILEPSALSDNVGAMKEIPLSRETSVSPPPVILFFPRSIESQQEEGDPGIYPEKSHYSIYTERDALWSSFYSLDPFYPFSLFPTNVSGMPVSSCSSKAFWKLSEMTSELLTQPRSLEDANYVDDPSSFEAPWCINGFRIHFNGALIGLCSCFYLTDTLLSFHAGVYSDNVGVYIDH